MLQIKSGRTILIWLLIFLILVWMYSIVMGWEAKQRTPKPKMMSKRVQVKDDKKNNQPEKAPDKSPEDPVFGDFDNNNEIFNLNYDISKNKTLPFFAAKKTNMAFGKVFGGFADDIDEVHDYNSSNNSVLTRQQYKDLQGTRNYLQATVEKLQAHVTSNIKPGQKWVLLNTYMRGGSTFLGAFFEENDDVFYWYEPVYTIYNAMMAAKMPLNPLYMYFTSEMNTRPRQLTSYEISYILHFLSRMMACNLKGIPEELLSFWFLNKSRTTKKFYKCAQSPFFPLRKCQMPITACGLEVDKNFDNSCHIYMTNVLNNTIVNDIMNDFIDEKRRFVVYDRNFSFPTLDQYSNCMSATRARVRMCSPALSETCRSKRIIVTKLIRGNYYNFLPKMLKLHNATYIIHYIRDPRGIIQSRKDADLLSNDDIKDEAAQLCSRMRRDFIYKNRLKKLFPDNIIDLKYEDLAQDPHRMASWIYAKLGEQAVPPRVKEWISGATSQKNITNEDAFNVVRKNSTATAFSWRNELDAHEKFIIDKACQRFYRLAGYSI